MKKLLFILIISIGCLPVISQQSHKLLRKGDQAYESGAYETAEENYRKALERKKGINGQFNLGNSVYQQQRLDEAIQHFEEATQVATNDFDKSRAYYNLANSYLNSNKIQESIDAYKKAIEYNPADLDAKHNLFLAKLMKQQEQQKKQSQEEQQDQNQEPEDKNEDQQQNQQNQQSNEQNEQSEDQNTSESNSEDEEKLSKEDALKLLQVIENEEKKVQEKLRKVSGDKKKPKKDW